MCTKRMHPGLSWPALAGEQSCLQLQWVRPSCLACRRGAAVHKPLPGPVATAHAATQRGALLCGAQTAWRGRSLPNLKTRGLKGMCLGAWLVWRRGILIAYRQPVADRTSACQSLRQQLTATLQQVQVAVNICQSIYTRTATKTPHRRLAAGWGSACLWHRCLEHCRSGAADCEGKRL